MNQSTRQSFKLHLPGLLKVLAEHLYSHKQVAVRELLQNAHDSCVRRSLRGNEWRYHPRIEITLNQAEHKLIIRDNGCGLTAEEIDSYLATIGRSYTGQLRENLALLSSEQASQLIGQFGFGFLSAFLIASEVTLTTRSLQKGSQALRWRSRGDEYYECEPAVRGTVGTTIELAIKPAAAFLLQESLLIEVIQRYADFLPIPIYVDGNATAVNLMTAPWEAQNSQAATLQYIERAFEMTDPLCVIPLHEQPVALEHKSLTLPLKGFLFVPPASQLSLREYGDLRVFIRRMFICEEEGELLPPWAGFVRGVVDCPMLQPTASREGIHQDEAFLAMQQALEKQLTAGLQRLIQNEPTTWHQIVSIHADLMISWALKDDLFFEQVADIVPLQTSRCPLTIPDYLALTDRTLYYTTKQLTSLQEQLLAEGYDVPVIDGHRTFVEAFLTKYTISHKGINLSPLDGDTKKLLRPVAEGPFKRLLSYYRRQGLQAEVASFQPHDLPAIMIYPKNIDALRKIGQALENNDLPTGVAGLVDIHFTRIKLDEQAMKGTLYLNATSPLVRQLANKPPQPVALEATLMLLYQIARLFSGRAMSSSDATEAFRATTGAIASLLK